MPNSYLPPVGVILVDDLQQVSGGKAEPGLLAGNEAIRGWVVVEVGQRGSPETGETHMGVMLLASCSTVPQFS